MEYNKIIRKVHPGWLPFIEENKVELINILGKVNHDIKNGNVVYPLPSDVFRALRYFSPKETKLVLLGQDPYIGFEHQNDRDIPQAHGLSFSVPKSHKKIPPSLRNIFKEIKDCYPESKIPKHGSLKRWANKEHILLLNSALTVIQGKSNSHSLYWKDYTDKLIKYISDSCDHVVFLLMGNYAIGKSKLIDTNKHKIFTTVHPSPLSAKNGFFGCQIFKKINNYYENMDIAPIGWYRL